MNGNELFKTMSHEVLPFMEEHGYSLRRGDRRFVKFEGALEKRITITVPRWTGGAGHHIDHLCEYRLPLHEDLYNNYLPYRTNKVKEFVPTISEYFFNLVPPGFDWKTITVMSPADIPAVARNLERICKVYSFPFLNRFSTVDAIIDGFRGERGTWTVQDPILRIQLLLLDAVLKHDAFTFNSWYEEAVRFCGNRTDGAAVNLMMLAHSLKNDYF